MRISNELYETAVNDWYNLAGIAMGCDMDNIREVFKDKITNDCGDCIDLNYGSICATFTADMSMYKEFGGKARLSNKFEIYNENGNFCGVYDLVGGEY